MTTARILDIIHPLCGIQMSRSTFSVFFFFATAFDLWLSVKHLLLCLATSASDFQKKKKEESYFFYLQSNTRLTDHFDYRATHRNPHPKKKKNGVSEIWQIMKRFIFYFFFFAFPTEARKRTTIKEKKKKEGTKTYVYVRQCPSNIARESREK